MNPDSETSENVNDPDQACTSDADAATTAAGNESVVTPTAAAAPADRTRRRSGPLESGWGITRTS